MSTSRNFYEILGVQSKATTSNKSIKKAYNKLALKYHPDRNSSQSAAAKWNEILTAYEVLKDPQKRNIYDQYGEAGLKSNGLFPNINDLFDIVFADCQDEDDDYKLNIIAQVRVNITLSESYTGTKKTISFNIDERQKCNQCHGQQWYKSWGKKVACNACKNGYTVKQTQQVTKQVNIPSGSQHGDIIRIHCYDGEVEVSVNFIKDNKKYKVLDNGCDLVMIAPIKISEHDAQRGGGFVIQHFNERLLVKCSDNMIQSNVLHKIRSKGMIRKGTKSHGDLFVKFRIVSKHNQNNAANTATSAVNIQTLTKWDMLSFAKEDQCYLNNDTNDTKCNEEKPPDCKQM
eukprot:439919_1